MRRRGAGDRSSVAVTTLRACLLSECRAGVDRQGASAHAGAMAHDTEAAPSHGGVRSCTSAVHPRTNVH